MRHGIFILADIGGYTTFLSDVGIEHAKEITGHLLNGMFEVDSETWKLGDVEGDCLFLYSDEMLPPEEVFAYLRQVYEKFRESLEEVVTGSTCGCGACNRSGDLTLKFVVHCGDFDIEKIAGQQQLIGREVVVAHRLLKNNVPTREYALLTQPMIEVAEASGFESFAERDEYDDIGLVESVYIDLADIREAFHKRREVFLTEADAEVVATVEIAAPPDFVWQLTKNMDRGPEMFPTLVKAETLTGTLEEAGSVHTCLHGDNMHLVHYRVAYDDVNRRATDRLTGVPVIERMLQTVEAKPSGSGTRFTFYYSTKPGVSITDEQVRRAVDETVRNHAERDAQGVKAFCEAEYAAR
jgi:uncharacterized protein YndB with AHSA1/START domain